MKWPYVLCFIISADSLAKPAGLSAGTINTPVCPTRRPTQIMYNYLCRRLLCVLPASLDALQNVLTVLVQLQLGDDDLRGVDADWHRLSG